MADSPSGSTDFDRALKKALQIRVAIIADHALRDRDPATHLEQLKTASEQILELQNQLPEGASPQLVHFLERCSYDKALAMLEEAG